MLMSLPFYTTLLFQASESVFEVKIFSFIPVLVIFNSGRITKNTFTQMISSLIVLDSFSILCSWAFSNMLSHKLFFFFNQLQSQWLYIQQIWLSPMFLIIVIISCYFILHNWHFISHTHFGSNFVNLYFTMWLYIWNFIIQFWYRNRLPYILLESCF